jgi:hypothetical protein
MSKRSARSALLVAAVAAIVLGSFPGVEQTQGGVNGQAMLDHLNVFPDERPGQTRVTLGVPFSPLLTYHNTKILTERNGSFDATQSLGWEINWLSWSAALLALAFVLFVLASRLKSKPEVAAQPPAA